MNIEHVFSFCGARGWGREGGGKLPNQILPAPPRRPFPWWPSFRPLNFLEIYKYREPEKMSDLETILFPKGSRFCRLK